VNAEPATVSFFHGIRGTPEANVARWRGQMTDVTAGPEEKDTTIAGQRVLTLFAQGTYSAGMAMATSTPKENWVVLGAVISGPQGDIHVLARGHKDILLPQREAWDTVLAGLSVAGAPAGAAPSAPTGPVSATVDGDTLTAAGVRFTVPSAWTRQEVPEATRVKPLIRYQLSPPAGSSIDPGSVNFFHGLGGTPERILSLWLVQVNSVQGRPEKLDRQINGMRVVSLLAQGVYTPGAGMTEGTPKENWVIMGAVVGGPQGDLQIIARGPKETLLPQREAWEAMLNSATPTQPMPEKAAEPATPMSQPVRP
jgi:hypothetical protein